MYKQMIAAMDRNDDVGLLNLYQLKPENLMDGFNAAVTKKNSYYIECFYIEIKKYIYDVCIRMPSIRIALNMTTQTIISPDISIHKINSILFNKLDAEDLIMFIKKYNLNYEYIKYLNKENYIQILEYYISNAFDINLVHQVIIIAAKHGDLSYYNRFSKYHSALYTLDKCRRDNIVELSNTCLNLLDKFSMIKTLPANNRESYNSLAVDLIKDLHSKTIHWDKNNTMNFRLCNQRTGQLLFYIALGPNDKQKVIDICKKYTSNNLIDRNILTGAILGGNSAIYKKFNARSYMVNVVEIICYLIKHDVKYSDFTDAMNSIFSWTKTEQYYKKNAGEGDITTACVLHNRHDILTFLKKNYKLTPIYSQIDYLMATWFNRPAFVSEIEKLYTGDKDTAPLSSLMPQYGDLDTLNKYLLKHSSIATVLKIVEEALNNTNYAIVVPLYDSLYPLACFKK